jgi:hypothetical protein
MTLAVVVPCYRQERFLPRTLAALESALAGRDWCGVLVPAAPEGLAPAPVLSPRWRVLAPPARRTLTPGAARNAGFAACHDPLVLFVDADVEVQEAWLRRVLDASATDVATAGYWGRLEEWFTDESGERPGARDLYRVGDTDHDSDYLATLALYRRSALERVGAYDPRLNSEEDFELGLRLRRAGFRLRSLAPFAARHWSGPRPSFSEIGRRWATGLCFGQGQVLRLSLGRPGLSAHASRQRLYFATLAFWLASVPALAFGGSRGLALWGAALVALVALMAVRKRSLRLGVHAVLMWTVNTAGMVVGFVLGGAPGAAPSPEVAC